MQSFAENTVYYGDGQISVQPPPDATIANGFVPETLFRYVNRDKVTDANGVGLFPYANSAIRLEAIDKSDPNKYLTAIGYKPASGVHVLKVTNSSTLTLGAPTTNGDQPVLGGANVQIVGYSRQIGDL